MRCDAGRRVRNTNAEEDEEIEEDVAVEEIWVEIDIHLMGSKSNHLIPMLLQIQQGRTSTPIASIDSAQWTASVVLHLYA
mmetsp:Transcript_7603/g.13413  ORF Transcript_7603/g.13413 Transcript_7603/m.13413 type:complete len:80 (-) Transcript_7603:98-337(-)